MVKYLQYLNLMFSVKGRCFPNKDSRATSIKYKKAFSHAKTRRREVKTLKSKAMELVRFTVSFPKGFELLRVLRGFA
jgi:hypothetical protein